STSAWPTSGGNNERTGLLYKDIPFPLEIAWTFSECSPILGGIIASKNTIYFADNQGTLYALENNSGDIRWTYSLGGSCCGTPLLTDNRLYIGNSYEALCLNPENGEVIWKSEANNQKTREKSSNSPLLIRDCVIFCDDYFTVYNTENGEVVTTKNIGSEPHANTGPCADSEYIYIPIHKKIEILSVHTLRSIGEIKIRSKITSGPVLHNEHLIVGLNDSSIEIISTNTMKMSWNYTFNKRECKLVLSRPACSSGLLFAADPFGMIYCFTLSTGRLMWEHHYFERIDSPLIICNNKLLITGNEYIFALSIHDGGFLWERGFDNRKVPFPVTSSPAIVDNYLYIGRDKLYAFKCSSH
ncbi:MAG: PQQ-binding-like beta-propeller repeat protein, partial [Spirochaetales bacterium]|nr:PQQ-binding-like beta-propeller repeat protein [Spirochaetales bacterium]